VLAIIIIVIIQFVPRLFGKLSTYLFQNISTAVDYKKRDKNCIYFGRYVCKHIIFLLSQYFSLFMS